MVLWIPDFHLLKNTTRDVFLDAIHSSMDNFPTPPFSNKRPFNLMQRRGRWTYTPFYDLLRPSGLSCWKYLPLSTASLLAPTSKNFEFGAHRVIHHVPREATFRRKSNDEHYWPMPGISFIPFSLRAEQITSKLQFLAELTNGANNHCMKIAEELSSKLRQIESSMHSWGSQFSWAKLSSLMKLSLLRPLLS